MASFGKSAEASVMMSDEVLVGVLISNYIRNTPLTGRTKGKDVSTLPSTASVPHRSLSRAQHNALDVWFSSTTTNYEQSPSARRLSS
jgi:hypothetical protein